MEKTCSPPNYCDEKRLMQFNPNQELQNVCGASDNFRIAIIFQAAQTLKEVHLQDVTIAPVVFCQEQGRTHAIKKNNGQYFHRSLIYLVHHKTRLLT